MFPHAAAVVMTAHSIFRRRHAAIGALLAVAVLAAPAAADTLTDGSGNTIRDSLVTPAGGGRGASAGGSALVGSVGQLAGGFSFSPSGSTLLHGVHGAASQVPPMASPVEVRQYLLGLGGSGEPTRLDANDDGRIDVGDLILLLQ